MRNSFFFLPLPPQAGLGNYYFFLLIRTSIFPSYIHSNSLILPNLVQSLEPIPVASGSLISVSSTSEELSLKDSLEYALESSL